MSMEELVKADTFFFITAIAVITVSIFILVICIYVVRILSDTKHITSTVRKESDTILADVGAVRRVVERQGKRVGSVFGAISKKRAARRIK